MFEHLQKALVWKNMKELRHFYIHNLILALVSFEEVLGVCVCSDMRKQSWLACVCSLYVYVIY